MLRLGPFPITERARSLEERQKTVANNTEHTWNLLVAIAGSMGRKIDGSKEPFGRKSSLAIIVVVDPNHSGQRFRLKVQIMAVSVANKPTIVDVPAGAEVMVLDPIDVDPSEATRQVNIDWRGQRLKVFAIDLRDRAARVESATG